MFTQDVTTDVGKVRLLLFDLDSSDPIYPDDVMIQALLDIEGGDVRLAGALGMESIAANRVMTMKVGQILDLKIDGYQVAKGLRETAKQMRDTQDNSWAGFDIAEIVDNSQFAYREKIWKLIMAEAA